ncbi:MAG: glycosyl hydrolase family 65 protein, partial [Acidimicrobiales bacterium]
VGTARLWMSLGHTGRDGSFHIDGVTGPDEYSALVDDNCYTNLMAAHNLREAAAAAARHRPEAQALGVTGEEEAAWGAAAKAVALPFDEALGVHSQDGGFTRRERFDFDRAPPEEYPLQEHFPYFELYRKQVVKQADLVLAMYVRGDEFSAAQKAANFAYYEGLTVRDSSLSAGCQAVIAAEVGQLGLARDYVAEASAIDLGDLRHDTRQGLHLAALAGSWLGLVAGFGGMRQGPDRLSFRPRLPEDLSRLAFRLHYRGRHLRVEITPGAATFLVVAGGAMVVQVGDEELYLEPGLPVRRPVPPVPAPARPPQPPGREPPLAHASLGRSGPSSQS